MAIVGRFFSPPQDHFFLFGPRGTGKSTWLRHTFPDALYVDLLDPELFRTYSARPERLRELVEGRPEMHNIIIVDEIQKVPELLDVVHQLIEEKQPRQFILTGSSSRKLKRSGVDLLAGRALHKTLHPFMAAELGSRFDLKRSLQEGLLPLVFDANDPAETLNSYVSLYLREEVQAEGVVRNVGNFSRFIEAISFSHGSLLNTSQVARECQVSRKTVEGYIGILEDLLLGVRVPVFTKRAMRRMRQHPKFYYVDAGVFRSVRPAGPLDRPEEIDGAALEGLVAQHLLAWIAYSGGRHKLYFWRTKSGSEVDFVVYGEDTFLAVEVKNSKSLHSKNVRSLRTFLDDYPEARACLLYRGNERLMLGGVLCLPCDEFLQKLAPGADILP